MQKLNDNLIVLLTLGTVGMLILAISVVLFQIRNQNRMLKQQETAQRAQIEHQKQLLKATISSQETERKRIGQDLHDDIGAALSSLRLSMNSYEPVASDLIQYKKHYGLWTEQIDHIIIELRHIAHHLSPSLLSLHGLSAALNKQLDYINTSTGIQVQLDNPIPEILDVLAVDPATALYRVLEELLNNTIKHAKATLIKISFKKQDQHLLVHYSDNGIGLSTNDGKGMGMQNIEARLSSIGASSHFFYGVGFCIEIKYSIPNETPTYD